MNKWGVIIYGIISVTMLVFSISLYYMYQLQTKEKRLDTAERKIKKLIRHINNIRLGQKAVSNFYEYYTSNTKQTIRSSTQRLKKSILETDTTIDSFCDTKSDIKNMQELYKELINKSSEQKEFAEFDKDMQMFLKDTIENSTTEYKSESIPLTMIFSNFQSKTQTNP